MTSVLRAGLLLVMLVACTEPRSQRCQQVCAREAACRESIEAADNFDEGECLDACAALERDVETEQAVAKHIECVQQAGTDCRKVIDCP
jgi:hypothetical protein